jgi:hypothetical protein
LRVANSFVADPPPLSPAQDANDACNRPIAGHDRSFRVDVGVDVSTMATTLSERERGFNDGLQAAIDYFKNCATAIGKIDDHAAAHRTALLIMVAAYQSDLRGLQKRGDAEMQAAFDAETRRSV